MVVTDVVFSMDGDLAPVKAIADACRRHRALLVLDEAHTSSVPTSPPDLAGIDVLRVGTLSKTLGSLGGFATGPRPSSTTWRTGPAPTSSPPPRPRPTPPPPWPPWASCARPRGQPSGPRLAAHVAVGGPRSPLPIIPVILGSDEAAWPRRPSSARGVWVPAIRPPTVPPGTARLRVTVSAAHTDEHIALLGEALAAVRPPGHRHGRDRRPARRWWSWWPVPAPMWARPGSRPVSSRLAPVRPPVAARKPAQSFAPGRDRPTPRSWPGPRGGPGHRLPAGPFLSGPHGSPHGRRRPRPARSHHRRPGRELLWPADPVAVGLLETAGGVRSPQATTATSSTWWPASSRPRRPGGRRRTRHHQRRPPEPGGAGRCVVSPVGRPQPLRPDVGSPSPEPGLAPRRRRARPPREHAGRRPGLV